MGAPEKGIGGRSPVVIETGAAPAGEAEYLAARVRDWSAQAREIRLLAALPWLLAAAFLFFGPSDPEPVDISRQTEEAAPNTTAEGTEATAVEPAPPPEPQTAQPDATSD